MSYDEYIFFFWKLIYCFILDQRWYMFTDMGVAPSPRQGHVMTSSHDQILVFGGDSLQSLKPSEDGIIGVLDTCGYFH